MTSSNEVKAALEDLGKFTIQEEVDEGANAVAAFKAFDRLLHRDAFLKVIYYSADAAAELCTNLGYSCRLRRAFLNPRTWCRSSGRTFSHWPVNSTFVSKWSGLKEPAFCRR